MEPNAYEHPGCMHPQLLAFDASQEDRRIVHFKWDTEWDTLWATTCIPPLLVLDCMGYKADLSVSFNHSTKRPAQCKLSRAFCYELVNQMNDCPRRSL